jgi:hypothetical protein
VTPGGDGLLAGEVEVEVHTRGGAVLTTSQQYPPGSPDRPPTDADFGAKLSDCLIGLDTDPLDWTWDTVPVCLRNHL